MFKRLLFLVASLAGLARSANQHDAAITTAPGSHQLCYEVTWTEPPGSSLTKIVVRRGANVQVQESYEGQSPERLNFCAFTAGIYTVSLKSYKGNGALYRVTELPSITSEGLAECPDDPVEPPDCPDPEPSVVILNPAFSFQSEGLVVQVRIHNPDDFTESIHIRLPGYSDLTREIHPITGLGIFALPGPGNHTLYLDGDQFDTIAFIVTGTPPQETTAYVGWFSQAHGFNTRLFINQQTATQDVRVTLFSGPLEMSARVYVPSWGGNIGRQVAIDGQDLFPGQRGFLVIEHAGGDPGLEPIKASLFVTHDATPNEAIQTNHGNPDKGSLFTARALGE